MDYYRLLRVSRTASTKEIKRAYLALAKTLHPDVTGNDRDKAELFKRVSEAHAVLSDTTERRRYDASRPMQSAGGGGGGRHTHPYATNMGRGDGGVGSRRGGRLYGLDEEVWYAHHYGAAARRSTGRAPPLRYGMNVAEERAEQEQERVERMTKHYKLRSTAGYFLRRDERLRRQQAEAEAKRVKEGKPAEEEDTLKDGCIIA